MDEIPTCGVTMWLSLQVHGALLLQTLSIFLTYPGPNVAQSGGERFPPFSECLDGGITSGCTSGDYDSNCISCDAVVTVDQNLGSRCSPGENLAGRTCEDLDIVLESVLLGHTTARRNCLEIQIYPNVRESYMVWANKSEGIIQNIVLRGIRDKSKVFFLKFILYWLF